MSGESVPAAGRAGAPRITAPARIESLDRVQDELERIWTREPELSERERSRLSAATMEIVGNIVEHASPRESADVVTMDITVEIVPGRVRVVVVDDARPVAVPVEKDMPGWAAESGRGLAIARALADEVRWERLPEGNRWTLVCAFDPPR